MADINDLILSTIAESREEMRDGFKAVREDIGSVREELGSVRDAHAATAARVAKLEGINQGAGFAADEVPTNGIARKQQPSRPEMVIPTPEPGATFEIKYGRGHSSPSPKPSRSDPPQIVSLIVRTLKNRVARGIGLALGGVLIGLGGWIAHWIQAPPASAKVVYVQVPAPSGSAAPATSVRAP